jgi:ribonuclease BN (tRNA processing enzyme)
MPDHEPALGKNGMINDKKWISGIDLAQDVDLLLHDAQYTAQEYERKKGWGHSSIDDAGLFASIANVKQLLFWHHDPNRTDVQLNEMFAAFKEKTAYGFKSALAREGAEIMLK